MIRLGIAGFGYWGPNVARAFDATDNVKIVSICDGNPSRLAHARKLYPGISFTSDVNEILTSPNIDAVAVITPVSTHFDLAQRALLNGKHVFVEKPFTSTAGQATELVNLAERKRLKIMVDHTFLYTPAVNKIKEIIDGGILGNLYYFDSMRVNLGLFQHDVNVVWDLAPHDLSIMDYLIRQKPDAVVATGQAHLNGLEDVAYLTLYFPNNIIAHCNVNWLSPVKVRTTLIGGHKKMLLWNDLDADEKIKIYDKGVEVTTQENIYNLLVSYRSGDMWVPKLDRAEALRLEAEAFVNCVLHDETPPNDGEAGLRVVRILEAATKSLKGRGALVLL
ncbi:MAG: Gfo/Idh/MocA family oxidoreductase [Pseudomonadota bacterium]